VVNVRTLRDFNNILKISLTGAFLAIFLMVLSFAIFFLLEPIVPFSFIAGLWIFSYIVIGAFEVKFLKDSQDLFSEVLISDIFTSVWIFIGVILILAVNSYLQTGGIFDFLGVLSNLLPFVLFGPPVMVLSIVFGSVLFHLIVKNQKKVIK
jgi:hypothetical protein